MKSVVIIVLIIVASFFSCVDKKDKDVRSRHNSRVESALFSIVQNKGFKVVHVFKDNFHQDTLFNYVLYHRGEIKPSVNFSAVYIETPVRRVACLSNIYVGCLTRLGLTHTIVGVDDAKNICNAEVRQGVASGQIQELNVGENLNIEKVLLLHPDIIFRFGTGNELLDFPELLKQSDIPVAISLDYREANPLIRASWLKFVAAFFEMDSDADSILNTINQNYNSLNEKVRNTSFHPTVVTEVPYKEVWYVPGGKSYMAALLKDAGANYLWADDQHEGSLALSFEQVFKKAVNADFWLNVQHCKTINEVENYDSRNKKIGRAHV